MNVTAKKDLVKKFLELARAKRGFDYDRSETADLNKKPVVFLKAGIARMENMADYEEDPTIALVPEAFEHSYAYMVSYHKGGKTNTARTAATAPAATRGTITDAQLAFFCKLFLEKHGINLEDAKNITLLEGAKKLTKFQAMKEIDTLKALPTLRVVAPVNAPAPLPTGTVVIPDGIYAIDHDGEPKCYEVSNGKAGSKWNGFIFLDRVSSDDRYSIRNRDEKERILDAIRADVESAGRLAAQILRRCRGISEKGRPCRRQLTDTKNPYFEMGYGPECGTRI